MWKYIMYMYIALLFSSIEVYFIFIFCYFQRKQQSLIKSMNFAFFPINFRIEIFVLSTFENSFEKKKWIKNYYFYHILPSINLFVCIFCCCSIFKLIFDVYKKYNIMNDWIEWSKRNKMQINEKKTHINV